MPKAFSSKHFAKLSNFVKRIHKRSLLHLNDLKWKQNWKLLSFVCVTFLFKNALHETFIIATYVNYIQVMCKWRFPTIILNESLFHVYYASTFQNKMNLDHFEVETKTILCTWIKNTCFLVVLTSSVCFCWGGCWRSWNGFLSVPFSSAVLPLALVALTLVLRLRALKKIKKRCEMEKFDFEV